MQEGQFDVVLQGVVETTDNATTSTASLQEQMEAQIMEAVETVGGTATTDETAVEAAAEDLGVTIPEAPAPTKREFFSIDCFCFLSHFCSFTSPFFIKKKTTNLRRSQNRKIYSVSSLKTNHFSKM